MNTPKIEPLALDDSSGPLVIKIGTSTLTQGDGPPDAGYIASLASQVCEQRSLGRPVILVTSGAISAGLAPLGMASRPRRIAQKQAAAAVGQGLLMRLYAEAFAALGIPVGQILLTRDDFRNRARYLNARATIEALLKFGAVPVVNENDTTAVDEIRVGDNDTLAALVASLADASVLLILSDIDGLYDKNPAQYSDARLIPLVERIDGRIEEIAGGAGTPGGTGGMKTKIAAAKICARSGVTMIVGHGRRENAVARALTGEIGTRFLPDAGGRLRSRQRWLAFSHHPCGTICVNGGARQQLEHGGKSLLPAGILRVEGTFAKGDLVQVMDEAGEIFAQGFVNYDALSLSRILGKQTAEIALVLGGTHSGEVIHRDHLVLT